MKSEQDPVSLHEYVLRRIHQNMFSASQPLPVARLAFRPTEHDTKGLSVFREKFISSQELANAGRKPGEYYIARLGVQELKDILELSVIPDPDDSQPSGHALIPELKTSTPKRRAKELQLKLAALASKSIVHRPESNQNR
ncbi:MAG: hypothetical protein JSU86_01355 [Phycisphaerales bacterium]|nr:MAG: hypothetical protein JSU86_01355 [Phycisphaerales bacterium]